MDRKEDIVPKATVVFVLIIAMLLVVIVSFPAAAGGLYLGEVVLPSAGSAGAGVNAKADDASTALANPAGMTRLQGNALTAGAAILTADTEFEIGSTPITGGDGGDQAGIAPILGGSYVHYLSEKWRAGISLVSVSGSALDPDDDWVGRFFVQETTLLTLSVNPSVAYKINDQFSVGVGALVTYATIDYTLAAPPPAGGARVNIDADDLEVAFTLGGLFELNPRTRFGLVYASETNLQLEGDVTINPIGVGVGLGLEIPLAQTVRGGVYHELNDRWALLASVAWEDWSALANQLISTEAGSAVLPRNWKDTWHVSVGAQFRPTEEWMLQAGFAYDSSPVDAADRTPDLPVDEQLRFTVGAEYAWADTATIGAAFVYADLGNAEVNRPILSGDYKTNRFLFFGLYNKWLW